MGSTEPIPFPLPVPRNSDCTRGNQATTLVSLFPVLSQKEPEFPKKPTTNPKETLLSRAKNEQLPSLSRCFAAGGEMEPDPGLWTALSVRFNSWVTHLIIECVNILQERLTSRLLSNQGSVRLRILKLAEPNNLRLSPSASHNLLPSH